MNRPENVVRLTALAARDRGESGQRDILGCFRGIGDDGDLVRTQDKGIDGQGAPVGQADVEGLIGPISSRLVLADHQ